VSGAELLPSATLTALAGAVERGALAAPFSRLRVGRYVSGEEAFVAIELLQRMHDAGLAGRQLAEALRLAAEVRRAGEVQPRPMLVWSDLDLHRSRDTKVVCSDLFRNAERSVVLSTFSIGHKAGENEAAGNPVLLPLAERMQERPAMQVRLFVNLKRRAGHKDVAIWEIEERFARWFCESLWPWEPRPEVYYDPRSVAGTGDEVACLHAKCVAVDDQRAFVTSANLTEAAHERNIEAGVLLEDASFARSLRKQFESLIDRGYVRRIPGIE
jgi:hypothetical protein